MRVAIPHSLDKDEVRRRMQEKAGKASAKASDLLGSLASVDMAWRDEDHLVMDVSAMGFTVPCAVTLEEAELVIDVTMPDGLGFARRMIEGVIREKGEKLLA